MNYYLDAKEKLVLLEQILREEGKVSQANVIANYLRHSDGEIEKAWHAYHNKEKQEGGKKNVEQKDSKRQD